MNILTRILFISLSFTILGFTGCKSEHKSILSNKSNLSVVDFWLSDQNKSIIFSKQSTGVDTGKTKVSLFKNIDINVDQTFQTMDGFGFALNGGSALNIYKMNSASRISLLDELFGQTNQSIRVSYLRLSVGASDLDEFPFSYNDLPIDEVDIEMKKFSLKQDEKYLIPILKEILAISPNIKIMASPWSAPIWMKSNKKTKGGKLLPEFYDAYSRYFVKYIKSMAEKDILIDAVTVQNEPLHDGNNPSMHMSALEQLNFVKDYLGPAFSRNNISTKIIIYDHNADNINYPISILDDATARKFVDGSAFHLYGGDINDLSVLKKAHPDKNLYFTEQWVGFPSDLYGDLRWHIRNVIIGASRNWCKTIIEWNLASDKNQEPHTKGGCRNCLGAVTVFNNNVKRNTSYYAIGHVSKFVPPGSKRINSSSIPELPNVAFITEDNKIVVIALNDSNEEINFNINSNKKSIHSSLSAGSIGTYIWNFKG